MHIPKLRDVGLAIKIYMEYYGWDVEDFRRSTLSNLEKVMCEGGVCLCKTD